MGSAAEYGLGSNNELNLASGGISATVRLRLLPGEQSRHVREQLVMILSSIY